MSWKPQVKVAGEDKWHSNGLAFATEEEAATRAWDLWSRWAMATDHRAIESDEPVNYRLVKGELIAVTGEQVH
jgi:hypothetical protein